MWVQSLGLEDLLEEGISIHFSILAWRIPWTERPGNYSSWGSQRVRHDKQFSMHACRLTVYKFLRVVHIVAVFNRVPILGFCHRTLLNMQKIECGEDIR